MDYLFFDIECANCDGGNGKICSFGYTLADENLNVVEKKDIVINPRAPFRLRGWGNKTYITLAYPEEAFRNAPDFGHFYEDIATMLRSPNRMIFGYAPENDAGFLRSEFERYRKPQVEFEFYDVQRIYKNAVGTENGQLCSLTAACERLEIETPFTEHKSCDDAYATLLVLKRLCEIKNTSPAELTVKGAPCSGYLKNGEVGADYFKPKTELKAGEKNMIKGVNRDSFRYLRRRLSGIQRDGVLEGKKVCFSWIYEFYHYKEMLVLLKKVSDNGGRYVHKVPECDIFVKKPENTGGNCKRLAEALSIKSKAPKIYEFSEFLALISMDADELSRCAEKAEQIIEDMKK